MDVRVLNIGSEFESIHSILPFTLFFIYYFLFRASIGKSVSLLSLKFSELLLMKMVLNLFFSFHLIFLDTIRTKLSYNAKTYDIYS